MRNTGDSADANRDGGGHAASEPHPFPNQEHTSADVIWAWAERACLTRRVLQYPVERSAAGPLTSAADALLTKLSASKVG